MLALLVRQILDNENKFLCPVLVQGLNRDFQPQRSTKLSVVPAKKVLPGMEDEMNE